MHTTDVSILAAAKDLMAAGRSEEPRGVTHDRMVNTLCDFAVHQTNVKAEREREQLEAERSKRIDAEMQSLIATAREVRNIQSLQSLQKTQ